MDAPDIRNDDGSTYNSENDSRITKVGNILRKQVLMKFTITKCHKRRYEHSWATPGYPEALNIYKDDESRNLK